jgi:hypothetical protein
MSTFSSAQAGSEPPSHPNWVKKEPSLASEFGLLHKADAETGRSGDERARTVNPRLAKPVLSQLSYVPKLF